MIDVTSVGVMPAAVFTSDGVRRVDGDATLGEVAAALTSADVGALVIEEAGVACAIVSERDIVHALASGCDPATTTARDIAHRRLIWCDTTTSVHDVGMKMMSEYVRHVLVEEDGRLVGIVSARDLLGAYVSDGCGDDG